MWLQGRTGLPICAAAMVRNARKLVYKSYNHESQEGEDGRRRVGDGRNGSAAQLHVLRNTGGTDEWAVFAWKKMELGLGPDQCVRLDTDSTCSAYVLSRMGK